MRILSVQVGRPRTVHHRGREIRSAIFKEPVLLPVRARRLGLEGDAQADLRVHGGPDKAVYAYDAAGYTHFRAGLGRELPYGHLGENLTVEGMPETEVRIGDVYRVGEALLQVTTPRSPCFKLAMRMEMPTFPKSFLESGHTGFYLRVLEEGDVAAGDAITLVSREPGAPTVLDTTRAWSVARGRSA
jgi:MOSC domain-containing protein YiiM